MRKLKLVITTLCLVATVAFAAPMTAYADDGGPQGTKNSAPQPPPPPPPDWTQIYWWLMRL
jgi:hypothetical protein